MSLRDAAETMRPRVGCATVTTIEREGSEYCRKRYSVDSVGATMRLAPCSIPPTTGTEALASDQGAVPRVRACRLRPGTSIGTRSVTTPSLQVTRSTKVSVVRCPSTTSESSAVMPRWVETASTMVTT